MAGDEDGGAIRSRGALTIAKVSISATIGHGPAARSHSLQVN